MRGNKLKLLVSEVLGTQYPCEKVRSCRNHSEFQNHCKYCVPFITLFSDVPCKCIRYRSPAVAIRVYSPSTGYLLSSFQFDDTYLKRKDMGPGNRNHHRQEQLRAVCAWNLFISQRA